MKEISQDYVRELFDYRDGGLYWKISKGRVKIGCHAGTVQKNGYRHLRIDGKGYYAHRLIFLFHYGYIPKYLDHIDGDPLNNDISNIRETTTSQNGMNRKKNNSYNSKTTSSIYKGVSWHRQRNKWWVRIQINGKRKSIGLFTSETDAARAYDDAANELFGEFARMNGDAIK